MENYEIVKLKELLLDSELLDELKSKVDSSVNIFDILKITNSEIRHSNILAWLLDPNENHGLGNGFIKRFFSCLAQSCRSSDDAVNLLMSNNYSFSIRREWRNIDLLITSAEAKIVIAIENKVKSGEHSNQLVRYRETVVEHFNDYQPYFVFLTLDGYDSSEPDVWHSIGYENMLEWINVLLDSSSVSPETGQILKQYHSVLWREIMGYSKEVIDLCNKIYEKHKEALDLIYDNIERGSNVGADYDNWGNEWIQNKTIAYYECDKRKMYFRTAALEKLFPTVRIDGVGKWVCYYTVANIPFPSRIYIEFGSQWFDENTKEKFLLIKPVFNDKSIKDNWQWHRLKTWKLTNYNPDGTDEFSEISESLKIELERVINNEIPKFEAEVRRILEK